MRAQALPPAAGRQWLLAGFALFRRNPLMLSFLVLAYWFTVLFVASLPLLGSFLASLIAPGLSVGLMQAARNVDRGVPIGLQTLYGSFRDNPRTLFALGALYLCCCLGVLGLSVLIDGGDLFRIFVLNEKPDPAALEESNISFAVLFVITLMIPVLAAWWFAPALAAWHRLSLFKSLFFSFIACQMNWRGFLNYVLTLFLFAIFLPSLFLALLLAILPGAANFAQALVMMPLLLFVAPAIFASFYASYRDIFGLSEIV